MLNQVLLDNLDKNLSSHKLDIYGIIYYNGNIKCVSGMLLITEVVGVSISTTDVARKL